MTFKILNGDNLELIKQVDDNSLDSIVTDPPYGISFYGSKWDYEIPKVELWEQCLRVLKPGGHCLIACGTRTQHRMVVNIEDAGFEVRDVITWVYGTGFPKSLDVSKAIDKTLGLERKVIGKKKTNLTVYSRIGQGNVSGEVTYTEPNSEMAKHWNGWGTALNPACEFFTLVRKPLAEKTIARNVMQWGAGGINIEQTRNKQGKWPANLIHDGSEQAVTPIFHGSRLFYCAKASNADREKGNNHPTVKPTMLMRYLCRLITPEGGTVFDPFMGSGSTGKAAINEGFNFLGFELEKSFFEIALNRLQKATNESEHTEDGYAQRKLF